MRRLPPSGWCVPRQSVQGASRSFFLFLVSGLWILISLSTQAIIDTNNNGLSDIWEKEFNNNELLPPSFDPLANDDGDDLTNEREAAAGTDPFSGKPPDGFLTVQITHVPAVYGPPLQTGGEPTVITPEALITEWPTIPGKLYTLFSSADLSPDSWLQVDTPIYGYGYNIQVGLSPMIEGILADKYFYRVAINDIDTDGDGFNDYEEYKKGTNPDVADRDDDGMPDDWEISNNLNPDDDGSVNPANGPNGDPDGDLLNNISEYWYYGNPRDSDTDDDGLDDFSEAWTYWTPLNNPDYDSDGLTDGEEILTYGTYPWNRDSDDDTLSDGDEVLIYFCNPLAKDTDGDWMPDPYEVANLLDPSDASDGILDADGDTLVNRLEYVFMDQGYDPFILNNAAVFPWDEDPDKDGLITRLEFGGPPPVQYTTTHTHPRLSDTDGDRLPDGWEVDNNFDPVSAAGTDGNNGDIELDGLTNFEEFLNGTNPNLVDTDGDGTSDANEIAQASDPTSAADGGLAPTDPIKEVEFKVNGDYASWRMEIQAQGPNDQRKLLVISPKVGEAAVKTLKLLKNNKYKITLHHTGSKADEPHVWYCWEARVDGKPDAQTFSSYESTRNAGVAEFFSVGDGSWIADNRSGLLSAHNDRYDTCGGNVAEGLEAFLVPVVISDDLFATGVDNLSKTALPDCAGYQNKLWIMAPTGSDSNNIPRGNNMKFWIPLDPPANLDITCPNAQITPATVTLGATSAVATWHGTGTVTSENVPVFMIGQDPIVLPIGAYCMKKRTLKIALHKVYGIDKFGNMTTPSLCPSETVLENYFNKVYGLQTNTLFDVTIFEEKGENQNGIDFDELDSKDNGILRVNANPDLTNATPNAKSIGANAVANFDVWVVGGVQLNHYATQVLGYKLGQAAIIDGDMLSSNKTLDQKNKQVLHTIAHELGHTMIAEGHPDTGELGTSPLIWNSQAHNLNLVDPRDRDRLMFSAETEFTPGELLIKGEWESIERWLQIQEYAGKIFN